MPLYYFHVRGGPEDIVAEEGLDYPDEAAARRAALAGVRGMIAADAVEGILDLSNRLDVTDSAGRLLFSIPFSSALEPR